MASGTPPSWVRKHALLQHTALSKSTLFAVYGREYYFGQGVQDAAPGQSHFGTPHKRQVLGHTHLPHSLVLDFLQEVQPRFSSATYHLLHHNCNTFSNELALFLVGAGIPGDILALPGLVLSSPMGPLLEPLLSQMTGALRVAEDVPPASPAAEAPLDEEAFASAVRLEFERIMACESGMGAEQASELAVSRVLERGGLL